MRVPHRSFAIYLAPSLLALALGCGGAESGAPDPSRAAGSEPAASAPLRTPSASIVYKPGVVMLPEVSATPETGPEADSSTPELSMDPHAKPIASRKVRLAGSRAELDALRSDRVFVAGNRAYRAQGLTEVQEGLEVQTTEPALEDVIESIDMSGDVLLSQEHLQNPSPAVQVQSGALRRLKASAAGVDFQDTGSALVFSLSDLVLLDLDGNPATTYDRILANGRVTLDKPTISFDVKWKFLKPPTAKLNFHTGESAHLTISTPAYGFSKSYTVPIAGFQVPIPGTAGAVTIGGKLNLVFSAEGKVQASIVFDQHAYVDAGLVGEGFPWKIKPYAKVDSGFSIDPSITGSLKLGAYLSPRLSLLVLQYDVAGVYAKLGIEATATGIVSPSKQCVGIDVDGKVGINGYFKIPFFSVDKEIYSHTWDIYNHEWCAQ